MSDFTLLEFENEIVLDFFNESGLLVLCEGLGLERIFTHFLHLYCDVSELVFVLNTDHLQQNYYIEKLKSFGISQLPKSVTSEFSTSERKKLYATGGVFFASSRILVMDFLVDRIPVHHISGILVNKAHKMADSCQECFLMRLFKQKNREGFIKGFTDNPTALVGEYGRLERTMKNLFCKKVFLWPRFHSSILACFEKHKPEVIELGVALTPSMKQIQSSLLEIVAACLRELKSNNPGIDTDGFTLENSLGRAFDSSVRIQLDPVWNQLELKTKHLVSDLRVLRLLLQALSQYDCVTFLKMLESWSGSEKAFGNNPGWIFLDAADRLFSNARYRVFGGKGVKNLAGSSATAKKPSDGQLLLEESPKWACLKACLNEIVESNAVTGSTQLGKGKILICASDARAVHILKNFLVHGSKVTLLRLYNKVFKKNILNPVEEASRDLFDQSSSVTEGGILTLKQNNCSRLKVLDSPETYLHSLHDNVDKYNLTRALEDIQPRYVILYDSSVHFVRQLEIFKACHPGMPLRIYFVAYQSSAEEQVYLTALRREKEAFQRLIQEKSIMVIPKEREGKVHNESNLEQNVDPFYQVDTKKTSGRMTADDVKQLVVVDMREFQSELPANLYKRGVDIVPMTLEIGDYILTPDICVERKSLSDLIGSIKSGRLHSQCMAMSRHYNQPMLLIEFAANKAFSFQSRGISGVTVSVKDLNQKLALLLLHFPHLRLAWCSSPSVSAQLFHELKTSRSQPDSERAAAAGATESSTQQVYNSSPYDFLLQLPGIDSKNCQRILHHVQNLQELCQLSKLQLASLLDSKANSEILHTFLNKEHEVAQGTSNAGRSSQKTMKRPFNSNSLKANNKAMFGKAKK